MFARRPGSALPWIRFAHTAGSVSPPRYDGFRVVGDDVLDPGEPGSGQIFREVVGNAEVLDSDLNVDHVLGIETRHCGRSDVIDTARAVTGRQRQPADDSFGLRRPRRVGWSQLGQCAHYRALAEVLLEGNKSIRPQVADHVVE